MINAFGHVFEMERGSDGSGKILEREAPTLGDGQVLCRIDTFALTANNATYALFGEAMGYYDFFPAAGAESVIVPVWGYATITQSNVLELSPGQQVYGFLPFADTAVLEPHKISDIGFSDGAAHRSALHPFYNALSFADGDPFSTKNKHLVPALRPLFSTAWLLEDFFADADFYAADQIILTSASSKTALGTAFCLKQAGRFKGRVIALTSSKNASFVEATGLYDETVTYEAIETIDKTKTIVIDFAGNAAVLHAVHRHVSPDIAYSCQVGKSHAGSAPGQASLPEPTPILFFAPDQAKAAAKRLGTAGFQQALFARWEGYSDAADSWFTVESINGLEDAADIFRRFMSGDVDGSHVYVVTP